MRRGELGAEAGREGRTGEENHHAAGELAVEVGSEDAAATAGEQHEEDGEETGGDQAEVGPAGDEAQGDDKKIEESGHAEAVRIRYRVAGASSGVAAGRPARRSRPVRPAS